MVITKTVTQCDIQRTKVGEFLSQLWLSYQDISHYILSFVHRSIVNERSDYAPEHNERLEFLWDAVLELVITHALYQDFPQKAEWEMTDMRSALVRWRNLAEVARKLSMQNFLFLGKWEEKWWWRENDYLLANTLEAFIGAIYVDQGYETVKDFILLHIYSTLETILDLGLAKDYKTLLQEYVQAQHEITPHYKLLAEHWPDHSKMYTMWVFMNETHLGSGEGSSKKKWQEKAAEEAYLSLKK